MIGNDLHVCESFTLSDLPSQVLILLRGFLSTSFPLFDNLSFLSFLIACSMFIPALVNVIHLFFLLLLFNLLFVCLLLLNICLPKLINSTGYWLPGLKQLVCAQSTHVPKLNYQQRAYYPNQPIIPIFKVGFHKISLENSARISRVRCIVHFFENIRKLHLNISQVCS